MGAAAELATGAQAPDAAFDRWARRFLNDPRDTVHLRHMLLCTLSLPAAAVLFSLGSVPWWLAVAYWAVWAFALADRFTLMLHCTSHRPLFKARYRLMNRYIPWVLSPFMGQSFETYFAHHMGMHHKEGNLHGDLSSTMKYRRDSFVHWLRYFSRFFFFIHIELPRYFYKKGQKKLFRRALVGELLFYALCAFGLFVAPEPTLVVFVVPFVVMRILMMAGNWGQHAFVDPDEPGNDFKSSITCINTRYNKRCFNDGYHIIHHLQPALHYTEMDVEFERNREKYGAEDAIVFDGIDFFGVWVLLMLGQHRRLAKAFVQLPGAPARSEEDVLSLLNRRLQPLPAKG